MLEVYHFDINGTVIGTDSTDHVTVEDIASEAFSRSINVEGNRYKDDEMRYYDHIKSTTKNYKQKSITFPMISFNIKKIILNF